MRKTRLLLCAGLMVPLCVAQVLSPSEIRDPELRALQQKHLDDLKSVAADISSLQFPYHFYLSRTLDVSEDQEKNADQRAIQFGRFRGQIVLQITGNYFASYSAELMNKEDRARRTVTDVMVPILKAAATRMLPETSIQSFALEVSHHVRQKALGVSAERSENVVLLLPREDARGLLAAASDGERTEAVERASILVNGKEAQLWPRSEPVMAVNRTLPVAMKTAPASMTVTKEPIIPPATPVASARPTSPDTLHTMQATYQPVLDRIVRDLDSTARFVGYAPPAFISFHKGTYLQLSITTPVFANTGDSRYRLAALAFDEHVARLIRPLMAYFKDDPTFDGIDFSTSIRADGKTPEGGAGIAVEYIFGIAALHCYEQYDCTGQQTINSGFVLINGERVGLDLQSAETGGIK